MLGVRGVGRKRVVMGRRWMGRRRVVVVDVLLYEMENL
jgi:hypothetical protein